MRNSENQLPSIFIDKKINKKNEKFNYPNWNSLLNVPRNIRSEAEIQYDELEKLRNNAWKSRIKMYKSDNILFTRCKPLNGLSKDLFLKRFLTFHPISNYRKKNCYNMLTEICDKLHPENVLNNPLLQSIDRLDTICCIVTTIEWFGEINLWFSDNSFNLWNNLADCLLLNSHDIVIEASITIAFLMYKLPNQNPKTIMKILENFILLTNRCCKEFDDYLYENRKTPELFKISNEQLIITDSNPLKLTNTDFYLVSVLVYSCAFLINYNFNSDILCHFVDCYIDMSEMCRNIYLDIFMESVGKLRKNMEASNENVDWIQTSVMFLDKLSNVPIDINQSNRQYFAKILLILRNSVNSKVPNYINNLKRQASELEKKLILSKSKPTLKSNIRNSINENQNTEDF